jgi:RNA polymerase sigma-70 factor (ECF subfamily)
MTLNTMEWLPCGMSDESPTDAQWRCWLESAAPKFLLFARQKTWSEADAQDLVQEAVVESIQRLGGGQPPPSALVFATIHRRAIDLARREARRSGRELAATASAVAWFDPSLEEQERAKWIQNAMLKLPENYREVITLKIWGELTFVQIAETLGISANTAASRYRYGLEGLRKMTKEVLA